MTTKLANILHCYAMGMGIKGISATFELSRNTVRKYVRQFQESGIPMEQLLSMPASRIQEIFGGSGERERTPSSRQLELEALLPEYASRLTPEGCGSEVSV
jgi:transposase-like protein